MHREGNRRCALFLTTIRALCLRCSRTSCSNSSSLRLSAAAITEARDIALLASSLAAAAAFFTTVVSLARWRVSGSSATTGSSLSAAWALTVLAATVAETELPSRTLGLALSRYRRLQPREQRRLFLPAKMRASWARKWRPAKARVNGVSGGYASARVQFIDLPHTEICKCPMPIFSPVPPR